MELSPQNDLAFGTASGMLGFGDASRARPYGQRPNVSISTGKAVRAGPYKAGCAGRASEPCRRCSVARWSSWGDCSVTCGVGTRVRTRQVCDLGVTHATQACDMGPCPWHCEVSTWADWGACSATCGGGVKVRTRDIVYKLKSAVCPLVRSTARCAAAPCPASCLVSAWGEWSACQVEATLRRGQRRLRRSSCRASAPK